MKSGLRSGILSDKSVLISCADQQSIPFNKINLAPRSGTRISRPQKASYMFNNLPIHQMQKETLINDFVIRSQIQKPLLIPARKFSTLSLDKPNALVRQVATPPGGDLSTYLSAQAAITHIFGSSSVNSASFSTTTDNTPSETDQTESNVQNPGPSPESDNSDAETENADEPTTSATWYTPGGTASNHTYKRYEEDDDALGMV